MDSAVIQPPRATPRPATDRPQPARRAAAVVPVLDRWYITAFLLALAIPPEAQFNLGTLVLSAQRVLLIVGIVPAAVRVLSDRRLGLQVVDAIALLHTAWVWVALAKAQGMNGATIEAGGSYTLEFLGSYLVGRALTASLAHARFFARRMLAFILVLAALSIPEMLTGTHLIRGAFGEVFGPRSMAGVSPRFGLTRAFASFDHPILWGVFAASVLGMSWYLAPTRRTLGWPRLWRTAAIVGGAFTSLSTGPLMACTTQLGLITWERCTRGIRGRWWLFAAGLGAAYIAVDALSNRDPITVFISYATLNPETGYARQLIWEYGFAEVLRHPLLGIGLNDWQRPEWMISSSVDNFWLLTAMQYGLPAVAALLAAVVIVTSRLAKRHELFLQEVKMGWLVSFFGLSIAATTVHLWGSAFVLFGFLLGMGVSIGNSRPPEPRALRPTMERSTP